MGYYLIENDAEMKQFGSNALDFCEKLALHLHGYMDTLDNIMSNGIQAGNKHDYLMEFRRYAEQAATISNDIGALINHYVSNYVSALEAADGWLYDASICEMTRDYSSGFYKYLMYLVEKNEGIVKNFLNKVDHGIFKVINGIADLISPGSGKTLANKGIQQDFDRLLAFNEATKERIKTIFDSVHGVDQRGGAGLLEYNDILMDLANLLTAMADAISPGNGGALTVEKVQKVRNNFKTVVGKANDAVAVQSTQEIIDAMLERADPTNLIPGFENIDSLGDFYIQEIKENVDNESWKMTIFQWDQYLKGMLGARLTEEGYGKEVTYEVYTEMRHLAETIQAMKGEKNEDLKEIKENLKNYEKIVKFFKEQGEDAIEYYKNNKGPDGEPILKGKTAEECMKELDRIGGYTTVLKYSKYPADWVATLLSKREEDLKIMDSLEKTLPEGSDTKEAMKILRILYEHKALEMADQYAQMTADITIDLWSATIDTVLPVGTVVETVGKVTGLGDRTEAELKAIQLAKTRESAGKAYIQAVNDYKADRNADNAQKLKDTFSYYKQTLVSMYGEMAKSATGDKHAYFEYLGQKAQEMKMSEDLKVMSYDEFCNQDVNNQPDYTTQ